MKIETKLKFFLNTALIPCFPYILAILIEGPITLCWSYSHPLISFFTNQTQRVALAIERLLYYFALFIFLFFFMLFFFLSLCFLSFCFLEHVLSFFFLSFFWASSRQLSYPFNALPNTQLIIPYPQYE